MELKEVFSIIGGHVDEEYRNRHGTAGGAVAEKEPVPSAAVRKHYPNSKTVIPAIRQPGFRNGFVGLTVDSSLKLAGMTELF